MTLNSGFPLMNDERLVLEVESKLYMTSPYWPLRFIWGFYRPLLQILGFYRKGFLIVTDRRLVEYYTQTIFWFIKIRKFVECVSLKRVKGNVQWAKKGTFLFFSRTYQLSYERPWYRVYFNLRGKEEEEVNKIASLLNQAVVAAQQNQQINQII